MKRAVIFYSFEGNTKAAAEAIAKHLEADIFEIEPVKPIPKSCLKYLVGGMQSTTKSCPEIKSLNCNLSDYDEIILGTPVWAWKPAAPVWSFIKKNNLNEKIKYVFTLSGDGTNEGCMKHLKKELNNIKYDVALADKKNPVSSENKEKLKEFINKIKA